MKVISELDGLNRWLLQMGLYEEAVLSLKCFLNWFQIFKEERMIGLFIWSGHREVRGAQTNAIRDDGRAE